MNSGERDELIIKLFLAYMRDNGIKFCNQTINSVGFGDIEYGYMSQEKLNILKNITSDSELIEFAEMQSINKAPCRAKSDVYINNIGYSLKSTSAAPPAIVNHTARPGFKRVCDTVGVNIQQLDYYIDAYWNLRLNGVIGEDTSISDNNCPFKNSYNFFKPVLNYFLFDGTGSFLSTYRAEYILEFCDPFNIRTWNILDKNTAVNSIWNNLKFCLRAKKGMPSNYDMNTYNGPNAESIARWTRYCCGEYRGALHIRIK